VEDKAQPLEEDSLIGSFGLSKDEALIVVVPTGTSLKEYGTTDISTELNQALTQPFPQEPHINDLTKCLSSVPLIPIPLLPHRHNVVTKYCFESGMGTFKDYFHCSYEGDCSIGHSLENLPNMSVKLGSGESTLHYYVDIFMREFLQVVLSSPSLKVTIDRNTMEIYPGRL